MYQCGQIYYIKNFKQGDNSLPKNRFCVVITILDVSYAVIIHKVTSKPHCDSKILKPRGNTVDENKDIFFFPRNEIIGKNGFNFVIDSYIHMGVWNISQFSIEAFSNFDKQFIDDMLDDWLIDLIYFIYKSNHIKKKFIDILEPVLEKLNTG